MAVMEPFFFLLTNNNFVFFFVLIATSVAVNLQFEKNDILSVGDVKRPEDKKPEFTDVVTNQTVVAGRQATQIPEKVVIFFISERPSSPAMCPTWALTRWPG